MDFIVNSFCVVFLPKEVQFEWYTVDTVARVCPEQVFQHSLLKLKLISSIGYKVSGETGFDLEKILSVNKRL